MRSLGDYAGRYQNAKLTRSGKGVLEVVLHTDDGPLQWSESAHRELPMLFADIAADPGNRVVVITGTGDVFCTRLAREGWPDQAWSTLADKMLVEGTRLLENLLSITVPVIGVVNGPAKVHGELVAMSDIVLASDTAMFSDIHLENGFATGDGAHIFWPMVLGPNRGRHFLLTGQEVSAEEALRLGVVQELLPHDKVLDRARDIAHRLAEHSTLSLRGSKIAMAQEIRRRLIDQLALGLSLETRADSTHWPDGAKT